MKMCSTCKIEKPIEDYPLRNGIPDYRCKACCKAYYQKNRKRIIKKNAKYQKLHPQDRRKPRDFVPDIHYRLRKRVLQSLARYIRIEDAGFASMFGYTAQALMQYIDARLLAGTSWSDYGVVWTIEPINPPLVETEFNFRDTWKLDNLQPVLLKTRTPLA